MVSCSDGDSSLEIKYRLKKIKDSEAEPEREDKPEEDGSSTPPPKMDRRRGSQVTRQPGSMARSVSVRHQYY